MKTGILFLVLLQKKNLKREHIKRLPTKYGGEDAPNILEILISDAANGLAFKRATTQIIHDFFAVIASENRYHPVIELINSDPWDGVDRLLEYPRFIR